MKKTTRLCKIHRHYHHKDMGCKHCHKDGNYLKIPNKDDMADVKKFLGSLPERTERCLNTSE